MRRYAAMVYRVCYRITRNAHDAEDTTQAAFLALHEQMHGDGCEPIRNIGGWLQQVAQRLSLDLIRGRKRRVARESVHGSIHSDPPPDSDGGESRQIVAEELEELPAKYRLPLILHYFGGMSHQEMAREMNCNSGTLRVRLHRAKQMLAKRLSARGIDMSGCVLAGTLEQIIHRAVTDSIVSQTVHSAAHGGAMGAGHLAPSAAHLMRSGLVTTQVKLMIGLGALAATTLTLSSPMDIGTAAANVIRRLPQTIQSAVQSVTAPMMRAVIPSIQASTVKPATPLPAPVVDRLSLQIAVDSAPSSSIPKWTGVFAAPQLAVAPPMIQLPGPISLTPSPNQTSRQPNWIASPPLSIFAPTSNRSFGAPMSWITPQVSHPGLVGVPNPINLPISIPTDVGTVPIAVAPKPAATSDNPAPKPAQETPQPQNTVTTVTTPPPQKLNENRTVVFAGGTGLPGGFFLRGTTAIALTEDDYGITTNGNVAIVGESLSSYFSQSAGSYTGLIVNITDVLPSSTPPPEPAVINRVLPPNNTVQSVPEPASLLFVAGGLCLLRRPRRKRN
jgi:RNA polymerase sigma factor (sigma-70 family)